MGTLSVTKPGAGAAVAPVTGQHTAAAPKPHVCTDACTHESAAKRTPTPAGAKADDAPPHKGR
jgi:hypothetical protein